MFDGGYTNDTIAEEPQQLSGNVGVGQGEERSKTIASVTVSIITKLTRPTDQGLIIHGKKIHHVVLIAQICEVLDITTTKIHLLVDDYTYGAPLEVSHVIGDSGLPDEEVPMCDDSGMNDDSCFDSQPNKTLNKLKVGDYVRCVGVVKWNQDSPNVVAYHLRYVDDPNEITNHILDVIADSMRLECLQKTSDGSHGNGLGLPSNTAANQPTNANHEYGRLSTREKIILKFVKDKVDEDQVKGVHINEMIEGLKAFPKNEINDSLNLLNSEGLCWQGDDEDTWFAVK